MSVSGSYVFNLSGQPPDFQYYASLLQDIGLPLSIVEQNLQLTHVEVVDVMDGTGRIILNFGSQSGSIKCVENIRPGETIEEKNFDGITSYVSLWYRYENILTKHSKPTKGSGGDGLFYTMERQFVDRKMITSISCKQKKAQIVYFKV